MIGRFVRLARERRGVGAVEFAVAAPFLILLYVGGYQLMDAISAYRKVTTATRTMADLTTRQDKVAKEQVEAIMDASRQVMTPYSTDDAVLRITQILIENNGKPRVDWSVASSGQPMKNGDIAGNNSGSGNGNGNKIDIPDEIKIPGTYVIYSELTYPYEPVVGSGLIGKITFRDQLFMNPRRSVQVKCLWSDGNNGGGNGSC